MQSTRKQFIKFAAGGAVGTACHYVALVLLVELLGAPVVLGTLAGFAVGALINYFILRTFVFATNRLHREALLRFLIVAMTGAAINTAIVACVHHAGAHYLFAQVLATAIVLLWNFFINKHWTFSD